ncbi:hypothetical protein LXM25_23035 [Dyadobacter sp. LJ53]|uniref:hypothetical protein n=1 Tax=Dyadobacter chenwenxiniae TaxID=2906456 RepID=UPI001F28D4EA|nr:hypothetical protein [Dyadobacter chenwenxiniae]MCF0052962.1 hypothetical protein [Dyadobacter chenwenxiniae]
MKLLQNLPTLTKAMIVAGMLGACQNEKEAALSPIVEKGQNADYQNAKLSPSYKVNRLLSEGSNVFQYTGPYRRIFRQINEATKEYTEFNYTNANQISSIKYNSSTQEILEKSVYVLNSEGKCTQSHHKKNGASDTEVYIYEYNSDGRVKKSYKESYPKDYQVFVYGTVNGKINLQSIQYYTGPTKYKEQTFSYYYMQEDKAKINPACIALGRGKYLPIFGNFNEHLVKDIKESSFTNQGISSSTISREFTYSWNEQIETVTEKNNLGVLSTKRKYGVL